MFKVSVLPFVGGCHFYFTALESFQAAFAAHGAEILADIPRYTDIPPTVLISSVVARPGNGAAPEWASGT